MNRYQALFEQRISELKAERRYRIFRTIERHVGAFPSASFDDNDAGVWQGIPRAQECSREITVWCTNDYLGMGQHPVVLQAMHEALDQFGAGAGGTRNISGTHRLIAELEHELAQLYQKDAALLFSSGYVANHTSLSVLGKVLPGVVFISDEDNHASIIEGMRASGAAKKIFRHNDVADLERVLKELPATTLRIIVCEAMYSMSGARAPLREIVALAKQYDALTFVDETHSAAVYGSQGAGIVEELGLLDQVDVLQAGLGKGFGVVGGYIAASRVIIDCVRSYGSGFIFTTSLPPVTVAGALASVRYLRTSNAERAVLHANVEHLKKAFRSRGISFLDTPSHLVPIIIGDSARCSLLAEQLLTNYGLYLQPINFPTVPRGTERFRVCPTAAHRPAQGEVLADALVTTLGTNQGTTNQPLAAVGAD